jgi:hypothetical protein
MAIDTGIMVDFGLKEVGMGIFLVLANSFILALAFWLGLRRYRRDRRLQLENLNRANRIEKASNFDASKFGTTFNAISVSSVPANHMILFYYTSLPMARVARWSGIPASSRFKGVPLSLRQPHMTTSSERDVFTNSDAASVKRTGTFWAKSASNFDFEVVVAVSVPMHILEPLPGFEDDTCLCMVPEQVLVAMRPTSWPEKIVVDETPWKQHVLMLSPTCIIRSFALIDTEDDSLAAVGKTANARKYTIEYALDVQFECACELVATVSVARYLESMRAIRQRAQAEGLVPLFHYTNPAIASLILSSGLRMSTQGQGDGGVYFSTLSPVSYGLGKCTYEHNIIKDCFGVHRVEEYAGKHKLDAVIVYACEPRILIQVSAFVMPVLCPCTLQLTTYRGRTRPREVATMHKWSTGVCSRSSHFRATRSRSTTFDLIVCLEPF